MKEVITIHLQSRSEWLVLKMVSSSSKRDVNRSDPNYLENMFPLKFNTLVVGRKIRYLNCCRHQYLILWEPLNLSGFD